MVRSYCTWQTSRVMLPRVRQTQVHNSDAVTDTLPAGPGLETVQTLDADLNALRSQVRRILHGDAGGNWYDDVPRVDGVGVGLTNLNAAVVRPYVHTQATASAMWTINHNLGFKPGVQVFSVGGLVLEGDVVHTSDNQCLVYFVVAVAGSARCS